SEVFGNTSRASTSARSSTTFTAFIRLCGSTATITRGCTALIAGTSWPSPEPRQRGGQCYFERGRPLSSHSPQAVFEGIAGHSRATTTTAGQPVRERPLGHLVRPWPESNVLASLK